MAMFSESPSPSIGTPESLRATPRASRLAPSSTESIPPKAPRPIQLYPFQENVYGAFVTLTNPDPKSISTKTIHGTFEDSKAVTTEEPKSRLTQTSPRNLGRIGLYLPV